MRETWSALANALALCAALAVSGCSSLPLETSEGIAWCVGDTPPALVGKEVSFVVRNELNVPMFFELFLLKAEIGRARTLQREFFADEAPESYLQPKEECTVRILARSGFANYPKLLLFRRMNETEIRATPRLKGAREIGLECMKQDGQVYLDRDQLVSPNTIKRIVVRQVLGGDVYYHSGAYLPVDEKQEW